MLNYYAMQEHARQRSEQLRCEAEWARTVTERRREARAEAVRAQILRPAPDQKGARIWRLSSLPAWSRGRSSTKSTDRGCL
jgi:hypothetical protein